jgi:hypothetical protein
MGRMGEAAVSCAATVRFASVLFPAGPQRRTKTSKSATPVTPSTPLTWTV